MANHRVSFQNNENVLKFLAVTDAQLCEYTKSHGIVYFKWVNFMVCKLFLNKTI